MKIFKLNFFTLRALPDAPILLRYQGLAVEKTTAAPLGALQMNASDA